MDKARGKKLLDHLNRLATESPNPKSIHIDRLSAREIVDIINSEDQHAVRAVAQKLDVIAEAAMKVAEILRNGGRLFYIGAGTSGRLGVLDAAECPPTFGVEPSLVTGVIAGGHETLVRSAEGIEDMAENAGRDLADHGLTSSDMVIGIAASVKTPYTLAGIAHAKKIGAATAMIVCNAIDDIDPMPDILIALDVGPEVITGSTRMKSGTATKVTLHTLTTTAMVLLGKCYGNLMVDLKATSQKLAARSRKILIELLDISYEAADDLLDRSGGSVKTAIAMHRLNIDRAEAEKRLAAADGFLWKVLGE